MKKVTVQHRVRPRLKECPLCKKPVTKAQFDGKEATYAHVRGLKGLGLRWQHVTCRARRKKRTAVRRVVSRG